MAPKTNKRNASKTKSHVPSDEEDVLVISEDEVEFLDEGVVQKAKKPSSCLRKVNTQTPCWKSFEIPKGKERSSECNKCRASIICVDKDGKISTTGLNAHLRAKHGNQVDVGAPVLICDIEKFENPTPRTQLTSMFKKVSKDKVNLERYDPKSATYVDITQVFRGLQQPRCHANKAKQNHKKHTVPKKWEVTFQGIPDVKMHF